MKALQIFTDEYLENCKDLTPEQILKFLDDFRILHGGRSEAKKSSLLV